ncbi:TetR/AcrR family transcriptional regulator [Cellulomonas sp. NS3]|uniref:TetR/AcrR family transcriptional regulator n=1 Tax=Cellulomonas sp. NS3 TaxID=2973977 RepID=UPI002162A6FB|nr:TetR family transcriptional regulator [Cellulomonas sp. NS3]
MTAAPTDPPSAAPADATPSRRGEETRARIEKAALALFQERGYEKTTMRAVATEAGVSLGNAYYYFASKEHLVQGFYDRIQQEHRDLALERLVGVRDFPSRLRIAEESFLEAAAAYHQFAGRFFAVAAQPTSPLNPFSAESSRPREASTAIYRAVVEGSDLKADERLLAELPELLWLAHMGVTLFWVHDTSRRQRRTRHLVRRTAPLVDRLVRLSRLRPLRPAVHDVLALVHDLRASTVEDEPEPDQPRT